MPWKSLNHFERHFINAKPGDFLMDQGIRVLGMLQILAMSLVPVNSSIKHSHACHWKKQVSAQLGGSNPKCGWVSFTLGWLTSQILVGERWVRFHLCWTNILLFMLYILQNKFGWQISIPFFVLKIQDLLDVFDGFCALTEHPSGTSRWSWGNSAAKRPKKTWHHFGAIRVCNRPNFYVEFIQPTWSKWA